MNLLIGMCFMSTAYVGKTGTIHGDEFVRIKDIAKNNNLIIEHVSRVTNEITLIISVNSGWFVDMSEIACPKVENKESK